MPAIGFDLVPDHALQSTSRGQLAILVTVNDDVWCCPDNDPGNGWNFVGRFEGSVGVEGRSFGVTKGKFRSGR